MKSKMNTGLAFGAGIMVLVGSASLASAELLTRQLQIGMSGSDVGTLQVFLAKDPDIYPQGKVTNYFGFLTKAAVSNFQARNGISAIGRVGPQTLVAINSRMGGVVMNPSNTNGVVPVNVTSIGNINNGSVNLSWTTPVASKGVVYYSTSPLSTYEYDNSVNISGSTVALNNYQTSQTAQLSNLQGNTTYYYSVYTTDQNGNVNMTWPTTFRTN